jgi:hypothetical protein
MFFAGITHPIMKPKGKEKKMNTLIMLALIMYIISSAVGLIVIGWCASISAPYMKWVTKMLSQMESEE